MKILLASNNKHKAEEIQSLLDRLAPGKVELVMPGDVLEEKVTVMEDGSTLEENAFKKAKAFYDAAGITTIADDTGFEVEALHRQPGIHAARFAGDEADDKANREKVLRLMRERNPDDRSAEFITVICVYDGKEKQFFEGRCKGKVIQAEKGKAGFGYDPIFIPDGYELTFAEMTDAEKNDISHRGKAIRAFITGYNFGA
ncbi:MAG: RdgB/HAM1 family non-canonical purine NTP pyrophosphatase [Bacteroidota bacterium]